MVSKTMRWTAMLLAGGVALAACTSNSNSDADDPEFGNGPARDGQYQLAAELAYLAPPDGDGMITIQASDFERVEEILGQDKPTDGDVEDLVRWAAAASVPSEDGATALATIFPSNLGWAQYAAQSGTIAETLGVSLFDVARFAEVSAPPTGSTVIQGGYDTDRITDALGGPDDGVWRIGDELAQDFELRDALPPLGAGLRLAEADERLLLFREERPLRAVVSGDASLGDDEVLMALAQALDHAGWYSVMIVANHDFSGSTAEDLALEPFLALGAAVDVVDDEHVVHLAYVHEDEAGAESNADRIAALVEEGHLMTGQPVADRLTITDTQVDDTVLRVTFSLTETAPGALWGMLAQRDVLTSHG